MELHQLSHASAPSVQTLPIPFFPFKIASTSKNKEEAMHGVVFTGERALVLMAFPDPTPDPHDVVIEMRASGMCGSDLHQYRRPRGQARATGIPVPEGPVIAGHEPCGVVVAVGTAVDAKQARVGQRVMVHHYQGCTSATIAAPAGSSFARRCRSRSMATTPMAAMRII
jgi:D-arabinose 1-dehydrogenase-like Zn-dependent alcohol dehydrogenase